MTGAIRTFIRKLQAADSRKLARWTVDRVKWIRRRLLWHAARLRMQAYDAVPLQGRLPPGSLAASGCRHAVQDDHFYLKQARRHGPIFKLFWPSGRLKICIVGIPLARRLLHQHRRSLRSVNTPLTALVPAEYLRSMDPAIHPHYRTLFTDALRNDLIAGLEPEIRRIIRRELDGWAEGGHRDLPLARQLHEVLDRITTRILLLVVLGVRPEVEIRPAIEAAYRRLGPDGYVAAVGPEQRAVFPVIRGMVLQIAESLRCDGGTGFGDSILGRLVRDAGPDVDDVVIGNAIYMVERGRHDFRDLLRWMIKHLGDHPSVVADLRAALAAPGADGRLAEACVMETLRLEQAEQVGREALAPLTIGGFHVPKGSWIGALLREPHRDPRVFPEPESFRPRRFLERTYSANEYAPFGIDEHHCIARFLTIRSSALFIEELVGGFTWSVADDGPREFGMFHWQPSSSFAIDIRKAG
jgi:cytochrome P450